MLSITKKNVYLCSTLFATLTLYTMDDTPQKRMTVHFNDDMSISKKSICSLYGIKDRSLFKINNWSDLSPAVQEDIYNNIPSHIKKNLVKKQNKKNKEKFIFYSNKYNEYKELCKNNKWPKGSIISLLMFTGITQLCEKYKDNTAVIKNVREYISHLLVIKNIYDKTNGLTSDIIEDHIKRLIYPNYCNTLSFYNHNHKNDGPARVLSFGHDKINCLIRDDNYLIIGDQNGKISVLDMTTLKNKEIYPLLFLNNNNKSISALTTTDDNIIVAREDGSTTFLDKKSGTMCKEFKRKKAINILASFDNNVLLLAHKSLKIIDSDKRMHTHPFKPILLQYDVFWQTALLTKHFSPDLSRTYFGGIYFPHQNLQISRVTIWNNTNNFIEKHMYAKIYKSRPPKQLLSYANNIYGVTKKEIFLFKDAFDKKDSALLTSKQPIVSAAFIKKNLVIGCCDRLKIYPSIKQDSKNCITKLSVDPITALVTYKDMIITGHSNGNIKVWNIDQSYKNVFAKTTFADLYFHDLLHKNNKVEK